MTSYLGHDQQRQTFQKAFHKATLHHAWILAGSKGLGKAGFAQQAAHFLLSSEEPETPDFGDMAGPAAKLLQAGSHPDFRLLRRGPKTDKESKTAREDGLDSLEEHELKRNISVDQVRGLQPLFGTQPSISKYRVVVIDAIDDLEAGGANALLKNLEEPPKNTIFLLVSHAPERLLPTIRSRCQMLRFEPLDDAQMETILQAHHPKLSDAERTALVAAGQGSPGRAIEYAEVGMAEIEVTAQKIIETGDPNNALRSGLARKLSLKAATPRYRAFLNRAPGLIAGHIRAQDNLQDDHAIDVWKEASELAANAHPKSLDSQAVVFQLGSLMASLAQSRPRA